MTKHCLALAIAAMLPFTASAAKLACKASVQDGRGIATAWVTVDGASVVPTKASFVFPPGRIAVDAGAGSGYVLGKPPQLPEGTLFLLAQYAIIANGNNLRIGLDQVEIDGPSAGLEIAARASIGGRAAGEARAPAAWRNGRLVLEGPAAALAGDERVREAYLGYASSKSQVER